MSAVGLEGKFSTTTVGAGTECSAAGRAPHQVDLRDQRHVRIEAPAMMKPNGWIG